ncbi:MAG: cysteine rich repeat-containing protein [Pseudomonadota bacterium]
MRSWTSNTIAVAVFSFMAVAFIGQRPIAAAPVFEACASEIESYCAAVTPGNGRLLACLYAHEDKTSDICDAKIADVADQIDLLFETLRYVNQECGEDVRTICSGVAFGEGRILSCLKDAGDQISASCRAVVKDIRLPED